MAAQTGILDAVIIGTGFSGLCVGIKLKEAGKHNFAILEKAAEVGGVWRANTYPGACCDVPANLYSFSFAMKDDWSRRYPPQPEIQAYMKDTARHYGLYPHIRFNTGVTAANYDDASGLWTVHTDNHETLQARAFITGVGQLGRPAYPDLKGVENFQGKLFHSADWDWDYDLTGKKVVVIGTGASAIQFIPEVAKQAAQLEIIQRTAPYVIPKPDTEYGPGHRFLFRYIPGFQKVYRMFWYLVGEMSCGAFNRGSGLANFYARITRWHMHYHVKDPELRAKLTPDYPIGCKRVLFSSNYFEAIARPNVDIITSQIAEVRNHSVLLESGEEIPADCIIYGTGFKATEFLAPMEITGKHGQALNQAWAEGAEAYLGITVAGFPNFFMLYGPNTNLGSNSIVFMIECQTRYIMRCLHSLLDDGKKSLEIREDIQRHFNEDLQAKLKDSVWNAGCSSWYHNAAGKVTNNWPGYTRKYRRLTRAPEFSEFLQG